MRTDLQKTSKSNLPALKEITEDDAWSRIKIVFLCQF